MMMLRENVAAADAPHLSAEELAAFVDGSLDAVARERLVQHLAICRECRHEVSTVKRLVSPPTWRPAHFGAVLAAAAALLVTVQWSATPSRDGAIPNDRERAADTRLLPEIDAPLQIVAPDSVAPVALPLTLQWRAADSDASYHVEVLDETGNERFSVTTADTTAIVPVGRVGGGARYYWKVDARRIDGRVVSSGVHHFDAR